MAQHVSVLNPEGKTNHIEIGQSRANCGQDPEPGRHTFRRKCLSNRQGRNAVRDYGCDLLPFQYSLAAKYALPN